jgi:aminotransferase
MTVSSPSNETPETSESSGTALRYELVAEAEKLPDVIRLAVGDPDLPTPANIIDAAKRAIDNGAVSVPCPPAGLPELRAAVADKLRRENHVPMSADGVVITTGAQAGLFVTVQTILRAGDEVLIPDPGYPSYETAIRLAGGTAVFVPTREEDGFELDPAEVEARITSRTRVLLIVSPGNPTAGTVSPAHVRELATIAKRYDLLVISDEIYEKLLYDGTEHLSTASLPGMAERTITVNGFSKAYCMTGWRIGWVAGPLSIIRQVAHRNELMTGSAPLVSQYAGLEALTGPQDVIDEYLEIYTRRRRVVLDTLDRLGLTYGMPRGATYVFFNAASAGMSSEALCRKLLTEARVLIFPGTGFGANWSQYMRLAWLLPEDDIVEAMKRVEAVLASQGK